MDLQELLNKFVSGCVNIAGKLLISLVVFLIGRLLIKMLLKIFPNGGRHNKMDKTVKTFINSFLKIALYSVLIATIIAIMGIPMASVLTVFASAGAAIALAVQGSFSNLMGGIMLLIFKPIKVGDFVKIGGDLGTVKEVGIFYTVLNTPDNLVVSIPNKTMTDSTITNMSRNELRRVDVTIGIAYATDIEFVKKTVMDVINANEKALKDPMPFVRVTNMADSSIEFTIRVWCKSGDFGALKSDLFEECNNAFEKSGIEVPFNQLEVSIKK